MTVDLTGITGNAGLTIGAELAGSWGYILPTHDYSKRDYSHVAVTSDYTVEAELMEQVHFRLGDALLTDDGRQALRIMAAKELASLASPGSRLVVDGHADRLDCDARNVQLSELRAKNVVQALKDILGDQLQIPEERFVARGHGERRARAAGEPDQRANRKWRRVDAIMNSRLIARLTGQ